MSNAPFSLPLYIDLGATLLYALTGAMIARRRHYDVVGLVALALVTSLGGALIRDGIFIQNGPPAVMRNGSYLLATLVGCIVAGFFGHHVERLQKVFLLADALGLGAYAVVGVDRALQAGMPAEAALVVGAVNACGGGLLRDVLVREEPLMFKPGQFYVLAAVAGSGLFLALVREFQHPGATAAFVSIGATFLLRGMAILFNWKTTPVWEEEIPGVVSGAEVNQARSGIEPPGPSQ